LELQSFQLVVAMIATVGCLTLSSCSTVKVKDRPGQVTLEGIKSSEQLRNLAGAPDSVLGSFADSSSSWLEGARKYEFRGKTLEAAGNYLITAIEAHSLLASGTVDPGSEAERALIQIESAALARFAKLWIEDPLRLNPGPYRLTGGSRQLELSMAKDTVYSRDYFDSFVAARGVEESGMVRKVREGCGAPMVGIREQRPERAEEMKFFPKRGLHLPVTLTIDSIAKPRAADGVVAVEFSMRNPLVEQSVAVGNRRLPLAANFSAPIAILLKGLSQNSLALAGYFKADEQASKAGIYLLEPYDPDRIPVILIHGLVSVPTIWRDIIPELSSDPIVSQNYQLMVFTYPSSYPLAQSAALLRESLASVRERYDPDGNDPLSNNMVVAGHSMGGMLTHSLVADFDDRLWNEISDVPFEQLKMGEQERERIREMVFFDPDPAVRRAVYFSAPHRGAKMAEKGISGLVSRMAKLPVQVLQLPGELLMAVGSENLKMEGVSAGKKMTSVQSLEPDSPMVKAMDASPYRKGVIYHSIIGDRGKGDTPNSSDGVVEYWSSHQKGAASELIVPTDHGSYKHPRAIEELKRILREHAR
jgi:pimeloyl-ACP methyl ester carboxylesterase